MKNNTPIGAGLPIRAVGLPWYRKEDFARLKAMMVDAAKLHDTWPKWHTAAQQAEEAYRRMGYTVVRAVLIPEDFAAFCHSHGLGFDAQARTQFASSIAVQQHGNTH